jgi:hypothetical protein
MRKKLKNVKISTITGLVFALVISACQVTAGANPLPAKAGPEAAPTDTSTLRQPAVEIQVDSGVENFAADPTATSTATSFPAASPTQPTSKPDGRNTPTATSAAAVSLNPLTNQACQDPSLRDLPPALVSVSNFPVTARPQAGLSYSPYVFELFIGEGMTRFLALFYCGFPEETVSGDNTIGPIRSGRLPYESLRKLYNGFLVMASASGEVSTRLADSANIFGSDDENINSALVDVSKLKGIALSHAGKSPPNLTGNIFDSTPPSEGYPAERLWVFYSFLNQVLWTYDPAEGVYLRAQDNADGSGEFSPSTDRLTGEALGFENVVVLFAEHEVLNSEGTLIDVNLLYTLGKAYLFRDGKMIPLRWSTENGAYEKETGKLRPVRFVDSDGNPVALKPGSVWVEFVHLTTTIGETEPGMWKVRFYAP